VKTWFHVPTGGRAYCGSCRRAIAPGELVLVYSGFTRRPLCRCTGCAGDVAPAADTVPALPATTAAIREALE